MIYTEKPDSFDPQFTCVSTTVLVGDKMLFLMRPVHKKQGGKFGMPAGGLEQGEASIQAAVRELSEETGIRVTEQELQHFQEVMVRHDNQDFIYDMYYLVLPEFPEITLSEEHNDYRWMTLEESAECELVDDLKECLELLSNNILKVLG